MDFCSSDSCFECQCLERVSALQKEIPEFFVDQTKLPKETDELVKPAIKTRAKPPRTGIPTSVQAAMTAVVGPLLRQVQTPNTATSRTGKGNRCSLCPRTKDSKYSTKCSLCSAFICPEHTESNVITCTNCNV